MCGGSNEPDAVFCATPHCHKALGEFAYVREELRREARWHETLAERVVGFIGRPHFLGIHLLWFAAWILLNTGVLMALRRFDAYPFGLLAFILSMETIFITGLRPDQREPAVRSRLQARRTGLRGQRADLPED